MVRHEAIKVEWSADPWHPVAMSSSSTGERVTERPKLGEKYRYLEAAPGLGREEDNVGQRKRILVSLVNYEGPKRLESIPVKVGQINWPRWPWPKWHVEWIWRSSVAISTGHISTGVEGSPSVVASHLDGTW